jgi:hypothetical protein
MNIRKSLAGIAAGSLALAGVAVATAPGAAAAGPSATQICNIFSNLPAFQSNWAQSSTFTVSDAPQGGALALNWTSDLGLFNGSPGPIQAGSTQVQILVELSGAISGNVLMTSAPGSYPAALVPSGATVPGFSATASVPVPANTTPGSVTATAKQLIFNSSADNYCSPVAGNYPAAADPLLSTLTYLNTPAVQANNPTPPSGTAWVFNDGQISATSTDLADDAGTITSAPSATIAQAGDQNPFVPAARPDDTVTLNLLNWPSAPTTAELCSYPANLGCVAQTLNSATTATASVTLDAVGATGAPYYLVLSNGVDPASKTFIASIGDRTLVVDPGNGPAGSTVSASGSFWNPGSPVTVETLDASDVVIDTYGPFTVNNTTTGWATAAGEIAIPSNTAKIRATQSVFPTGTATVSYTWEFLKASCSIVSPATQCSTQQEAKVTITPGNLSQAATATGNVDNLTIQFPSVQSQATSDTTNGTFNEVTVTDARGGVSGWSLTASLTNISGSGKVLKETGGGSAVIAGSNLIFTAITCEAQASSNSALGVTPGNVPTPTYVGLDGTQTLCTKNGDLNGNGSTSGIYDINGGLQLTVPAFTKATSFSGVLQVTLA